jgi:hypothetical protein
MKLVLGAAIAAALILTPSAIPAAYAQSGEASASAGSRCPELAPEPVFPDGATATAEQVGVAEEAYQAWAETSRTTITCRRAEYEELVALAQTRREEHNAAAARLNAVTGAWVVEREEYCARPRTRCQSDQ